MEYGLPNTKYAAYAMPADQIPFVKVTLTIILLIMAIVFAVNIIVIVIIFTIYSGHPFSLAN